MAENEINKVSWNIAASQAQYVFELLKRSMGYYLDGNLSKWYWTLSALREITNHASSETRQKKLNEIEGKIQNSLKYWSKYQSIKDGYVKSKLNNKELYKKNLFATHVRTYQREIMDLLNELGYFPSKEDRSKLTF